MLAYSIMYNFDQYVIGCYQKPIAISYGDRTDIYYDDMEDRRGLDDGYRKGNSIVCNKPVGAGYYSIILNEDMTKITQLCRASIMQNGAAKDAVYPYVEKKDPDFRTLMAQIKRDHPFLKNVVFDPN